MLTSFFRKEKDGKSVIVLPEKPVPITPHKGVVPLGTYEKLAEELEFMPAQLLREQLLMFLAENDIPIYDYAEVDKYLIHEAEKQKKYWIWRPLRERDKPKDWINIEGHYANGSTESAWRAHGSYRRDESAYRPYDKAIPIHILQDVKKIQDRFKDKLSFFVSDYDVPKPDPFIMVTALDVGTIIFGVWDEPAFYQKSAVG